eukprot:c11912_g1_i3.p1 GENE.c11912_g1_i3~~c11912_g1_i3.p1  ORF type:complete len:256 (+),score=69.27 c11912_g1_i3:65-832(+)
MSLKVSPEIVTFRVESVSSLSNAVVWLESCSTTGENVVFRIKTTDPLVFSVSPNQGLLRPNEKMPIKLAMKPSQSIIEEKKSKTRFQVEYFATTGFEVVAPQETDDVKQLKIKMEAHMILGAPSEAPSGTFESRDPVHAPQQPPTMPVPPPRPSFSISELRTSTEAATRECEQLRKLVETIQQERDNLVSSKEALALDRDHYKNALEITVESLKSAQNQLKQLEKQQALQQQQHQQLKQEQIQLQLQQLTGAKIC